MLYSTYLGGSGLEDEGYGVAVDGAGNAYVTGITGSTNFPSATLSSPFRGKPDDGFVAKLNPSLSGGASLVYSSYLGGSEYRCRHGIAVDSSGNAYVTGSHSVNRLPHEESLPGPEEGGERRLGRLRDQDHGKLRPCQVATNPRADDGPDTALPAINQRRGLSGNLILEHDRRPAASSPSGGHRFTFHGFTSAEFCRIPTAQLQIPSKRLPATRV